MTMLMRTDPFRELDRLTQQVFGGQQGTWSRPAAMPMEAYRQGNEFVVAFDLPGVDPAGRHRGSAGDHLTTVAQLHVRCAGRPHHQRSDPAPVPTAPTRHHHRATARETPSSTPGTTRGCR